MTKVLIIDDDSDIVDSMRLVLESKGYTVTSASSGKEAFKKTDEGIVDIIILDLMMEYSTEGFDIAKGIKAKERYSNVPIIMLTAIKDEVGVSFKKDVGKEKWLCVDDYLEKPLKPQELIAKVESLLKDKNNK